MAIRQLLAATLVVYAALAQGPPPPGFRGGPPGGPPMMRPGDGVWQRNAYFGELETFDSCFGHQPGNGQYHHHVQPVCLRAQLNDNIETVHTGRTGSVYREKSSGWQHSPILGWAFDGYPIYGPYGYADPRDPKSAIQRMRTSFRLRQISARDSLPEWTLSAHEGLPQHLEAGQQGPPINEQFPLGRYLEDYEFVAGLGDLDQYNGRFTVTPEFPKGTYAYFVTIDEQGKPAFPFIIGLEYYGKVNGGRTRNVPADAKDYFSGGAGDALLKSWRTSSATARAISGWDPSAGPQTTWPADAPDGAHAAGGVDTPVKADVQRIRDNDSAVYINSNGLPSYVIGPWFESRNGGVFRNFPSAMPSQMRISRAPEAASGTHSRTPMGPVGIWVNGVAVFNAMDGASYSRRLGNDTGGGLVAAGVIQVSSASKEQGPTAPGSLVTAYANFEAELKAPDGKTTVTLVDAAGASHVATVLLAAERQVEYRVPEEMATGVARVSINAGGVAVPGELNIVPVYPGVYQDGAVCGKTLVLYGTGFTRAKEVSVSVDGQTAGQVTVLPQLRPGVDEVKASMPPGLVGSRKVRIVVTAQGKPSNAVECTR